MENSTNKVVYSNGELELNISFDKDTIWLTQNQLSELFDVTSHSLLLEYKSKKHKINYQSFLMLQNKI